MCLHRIFLSAIVTVGFWSTSCLGQTVNIAELVDGKIKQLAGGFKFTEGPAADDRGNVYFTDIPNARILVWTIGGELKTHREKSGKANGLYFTPKGSLLACEGATYNQSIASGKSQNTHGDLRRKEIQQPQ